MSCLATICANSNDAVSLPYCLAKAISLSYLSSDFLTANSVFSSSVIARASNSLCSNDFNASSCAFISVSAANVAAVFAASSSAFKANI